MNSLQKIFPLFLASLAVLILVNCGPEEKPYDLVLINGFIIDGSGNPWFRADIAIQDKKIVNIGWVDQSRAKRIIDVENLVVAPGFIDVHTHCDREISRIPTVDNYILQGVTSVVGGNCGGHPYPLSELFSDLRRNGTSVNFGCLIGHNTIRREVMGFKMEDPSSEEMEKMKDLVAGEMKAGALGLSTGLSYLPGIYSKTEEIVELASEVASYGGIYASHIRDQGRHITEAIQEAITVGEKNGIPVQISHIKLADDAVWNEVERITHPVEEARGRGVEVTIDQYPYTATSSGFTSSFPSWAFEGGREKFLERLEDKEKYEKIKSFVIQRRLTSTKSINKLETIYISRCEEFPEYEGKNLQQILISQKRQPTVSNAAELIMTIEKEGGASGVFFQMAEEDVEELMRLSYNMHASDGGVQEMGKGVPHPRNYGTFPRVIGVYVREKGILSLEEAIRKMTSLPAQTFRLKNRGMIREGMYADITVFDKETFMDKATFSQPHQYSQGLAYVIVNGEVVAETGKHTGRLPGMILYGPGKT
ncbi:MAG: N-acyl-D-amino-acid deacylase family protein [Candidatus Aminicenantes bacterium]